MDNLIGQNPYNGLVQKGYSVDETAKKAESDVSKEAKVSNSQAKEQPEIIQGGLDALASTNRALIGMEKFEPKNQNVDFSKMSDEQLLEFASSKLGTQRVNDIEQAVNGEFENGVKSIVDQIKTDKDLSEFVMSDAQIYAAAAKALVG